MRVQVSGGGCGWELEVEFERMQKQEGWGECTADSWAQLGGAKWRYALICDLSTVIAPLTKLGDAK